MYSDPELVRVGFDEGGWTTDDIAEHFRDKLAQGINLDRSDPAY